MIDTEEVAVALDAFPHLNEQWRARILGAFELAPDVDPEDSEDYFESPAYFSWSEAGETYLTPPSYSPYAYYVTLEEAAGYASIVTKTDLLKALHRGSRMVGVNR